jgi:hypothetical protein
MSERNDPCGEHESPQETLQRRQAEQKAAQEYHETAKATDTGQMPKLDFSTFVMSLSSTVLVHLGEIPDLQTGKESVNIPLAKQTIDILGMIQEKTKGNLTCEEERLIRDLLFELRVKFVQRTA